MVFFARKLMWDSTVSYWSPSVAILLCFCVSVRVATLPAYRFCQNDARVGLDG